MEIKKVLPKPYEKSISPGISFDVEIGYTKYEKAIIGISGWLETDDNINCFNPQNPDKIHFRF